MKAITPHLWFDKEAGEAAELYTSLFDDSAIGNRSVLHDTPSGSVELVAIKLAGQDFRLISAGPFFKFTPAVSFLVACETADEVDALWRQLSAGGSALMEIGAYPFSPRYGWLQDRYGLSWQLMLAERPARQKITPTLMFTGTQAGRAEEAINFYTSIFDGSSLDHIMRRGSEDAAEPEGTVKHAGFTLGGYELAAMDSARAHGFTFNEAISFIVPCETQQEIDRYWSALSADPKSEQCGWLKDKFGLSWQITPTRMEEMLSSRDQAKIARVTQAFLKMKKFDITTLEAAYAGA
jgi:predicted 3-demethylubiquinone-9 3-methyltransferase (glyoxalase superfamily)